ncbi:LysR family transcriptional regulator [Novosphingobium pentaromativorans]|uniref:HTH lysR-type domain-containing protein n=1 Tax=Novosphingobium pentaromativorans US6-1 TaxID=1088721 RepID=G6EGK6_9SPHN|nr:LysR family transcriptional regulator [Novosphingobium pentaromativorans]AIT82165.1 hypothetical protein JI59_21815 [Novosphingobium pentaromativorans US6-1]EHJ59553.1 hypothetical protein NSU_3436 [Novosphingobium pentaromativorans US6-1]
MRFRGLDLNLIHVLDILLDERSVSRAARKLNLSQPAVSAALSRLREYFHDELLIPVGRQMVPTAFSASLRPTVREMLGKAEQLTSATHQFEPATSRRRFRIGASDYVLMVVIAPMLRRLLVEAPGLEFEIIPPGVGIGERLDSGDIDVIISPAQFLDERHPVTLLFHDTHVILGAAENPVMATPPDIDRFCSAKQVTVSVGPHQELTFAERHLQPYRQKRRLEVFITSFSALGQVLAGTDRIAVVQRRLAEVFVESHPLVIQPLPIALPPMEEVAQIHATRVDDAGIRWLLAELQFQATGERPSGPVA